MEYTKTGYKDERSWNFCSHEILRTAISNAPVAFED